MTEKMGQKKVVDRTVAITLGIVCIILLAGLVSAIAVYMPMVTNLESQRAELESQIAKKDNTISSLNSQISALQSNLNQINNSISAKDYQIARLDSQISTLLNIIYLNASVVLVSQSVTQAANESTTVFNEAIQFAGYFSVVVQSSSNTTYVEVIYSSSLYGVNYENSVTVGTSGTAAFPVLPATIDVRVGNTELVDSVDATVTVIYCY